MSASRVCRDGMRESAAADSFFGSEHVRSRQATKQDLREEERGLHAAALQTL